MPGEFRAGMSPAAPGAGWPVPDGQADAESATWGGAEPFARWVPAVAAGGALQRLATRAGPHLVNRATTLWSYVVLMVALFFAVLGAGLAGGHVGTDAARTTGGRDVHATRSHPGVATRSAPVPPRQCLGPCTFTFPRPDLEGAASVRLISVTEAVPCPAQGVCSTTTGHQLDEVAVSECAGRNGITALFPSRLALSLAGGNEAVLTKVTFDPSVAGALGGLGPVAAGQCVTGNAYFSAVPHSHWQSVSFAYDADSAQWVYTWKMPPTAATAGP